MRPLLILFLLCAALGGGAYYAVHSFGTPGPLAAEATVVIAPKTPVRAIADQLAAAGVIAHRKPFLLMLMLDRRQGALKAGEYRFPPHISAREAEAKMVRGEVVVHDVTIPEGLDAQEITEVLNAEPLLTGAPGMPEEGGLLPETYRFLRGDTRASLVARMKKAQGRTLAALWPARAPGLPFATPEQAVILASIVEKETGKAEERPHIASVFLNRLAIGMPLQSDPTTIYGLYRETGVMRRLIGSRDLAHPTPYNTYTQTGLPRGPICNPGRASLEAVLHPSASRDLYFVADGTGGHRFAATLDQHHRNVAAYRAGSAGH